MERLQLINVLKWSPLCVGTLSKLPIVNIYEAHFDHVLSTTRDLINLAQTIEELSQLLGTTTSLGTTSHFVCPNETNHSSFGAS